MTIPRTSPASICPVLVLVWFYLWLPVAGHAELPMGSWSISGEITDLVGPASRPVLTNIFTLCGHCNDGRFVLDITPVENKNNLNQAESVGWDGKLLCYIRRWANPPERADALRTNAVGYVEPDVFSRYATESLDSVLIAFADSNLLSKLEKGQIHVILGPNREYPEEENSYKIRLAAPGSTEIEAFTPGLKLGPTGLIPVTGFADGFTRWRHRSTITPTTEKAGKVNMAVEYDRFMPWNGKLEQIRTVRGEIGFEMESNEISSFRPSISEASLRVRDYSCRYEIYQWTKGIEDWHVEYELTGQAWDFDTNFINGQLSDFKTNMIAENGIPKEELDQFNTTSTITNVPIHGRGRIVVIGALIGFSALSAALFRMMTRRTSQSDRTTET